MPRFSIIMPCHNAAATLAETLGTILAQTFADWELVCMDDGSTDATPGMLAQAGAADPRVRVYRQANSGPARARNGAVEMARGEILVFLDSDDLWSPRKLATLDRGFCGPDAPGALYSRVGFFRDDPSRPRAVSTVPDHDLRLRDLVGENPVCTMSSVAVTATAWRLSGGIDPEIVHSEDLEWLIRLVASGARVRALNETLTFYRANENGLSANLAAMHCGWARAVRTAMALDPTLTDEDIAQGEARHLRYLARRALRTGQPPRTALQFALRGLRRSPRGFFDPVRRGGAVLAGSLAAPVMPGSLRRLAFQE